MSFDETMDAEEREYRMSQSLSSRAMSFDAIKITKTKWG